MCTSQETVLNFLCALESPGQLLKIRFWENQSHYNSISWVEPRNLSNTDDSGTSWLEKDIWKELANFLSTLSFIVGLDLPGQ